MSIYSQILILDNKLRPNNLFRFIILFFIFLNPIVVANQGIFGITGAGHYDALFVNLAPRILQGNWLGKYNNLTLAKGYFYPLFIAFNFILGYFAIKSTHFVYYLGININLFPKIFDKIENHLVSNFCYLYIYPNFFCYY